MSEILFNNEAQPAAPASGKTLEFVESTNGRVQALNSTGVLQTLGGRASTNFCRNSGFWFAQRQAPGTLTSYSNTSGRAISADGWGITNENLSVQYIRTDTSSAPETGILSRYYGSFTKITSTGKAVVSQVLESFNCQSLRGRTVRIQMWAKGIVVGSQTVKMALLQLTSSGTVDTIPATFISAFGANTVDPTLGTNLSYIAPKSGVTGDNATAATNSFTCTVTASWQRFGGVVDVPTTAKNLVLMIWSDSQLAATNGFALSQVSITDGYEIQDWAPQIYESELSRVQRYYQKSFLVDTLPNTNIGVNTGEYRHICGKANAANGGFIPINYPVPMRATPATNTIFNPAAANAQIRDVTGSLDYSASTITGATANNFYVVGTSNATSAVGNLIAIHFISDAEL